MTPDPVWAGVLCAAVAAVGGLGVPRLVAGLPEPDDETGLELDADLVAPVPDPAPAASPPTPAGPGSVRAESKVPYAVLGARPRLGLWCALVAGALAGLMGASRGWQPDLPVWVYLSVVGVALGYVDWRTRLLPRLLVLPSYAVVGVLLLVALGVERDTDQLVRALIAWAATFGVYFLLWYVYPAGLGYGDVRLSGVLGMALGWLGWPAVVVGTYSGWLLGGVVGGVLALLRVVDRRGYPFGPFMLAGAVLGVLAADGDLSSWL